MVPLSLWEDGEELSSGKRGEDCSTRREQHMPRHGESGTLGSGDQLCDAPDTDRITEAFLRMAFKLSKFRLQTLLRPLPDTHHAAVTEPTKSLLCVILSLASCSIWWKIRSGIQR